MFKRCRATWLEAGGVCAFVQANDLLRQYVPAMAREAAEARAVWEECKDAREELKEAKRVLALKQGRFFALLELGLGPGASNVRSITDRRDQWAIEERRAWEALEPENVPPILAERTAHTHQFHTEQGWRKGAERFGELVGLGGEQQLAVRVAVLEADATHLRMQAKAALALLSEAQATYEEALAQLNASQGEIDLLSGLRERACTLAELATEEEEAELECEVLRGTLDDHHRREIVL